MFDRSKPFYPIVMTYLVQLFGLKELLVQGVPGVERVFKLPETITDAETIKAFSKISGPLNLEITGDSDRPDITIQFVSREVTENHRYLTEFQIQASYFCLVMAHEVTKGKLYRDLGAKWEFLRHARNAIAHSGKFHLLNGEPRNNSEWRNIRIESTMHGKPLFKKPNGEGYLKVGDPIALLWEIEQDYPGITI